MCACSTCRRWIQTENGIDMRWIGDEEKISVTNLFRLMMNEGLNVRFYTLLKRWLRHARIYFATLVSTFHLYVMAVVFSPFLDSTDSNRHILLASLSLLQASALRTESPMPYDLDVQRDLYDSNGQVQWALRVYIQVEVNQSTVNAFYRDCDQLLIIIHIMHISIWIC